MVFKKGDMAYFPAQGVGVIQDVESKHIAGMQQDFYIVEVLSSGARMMVPASVPGVSRAGMRDLIGQKQIKKIYDILKTPCKVSTATWNRRFREYNDKLKTGSPEDIASVLRELHTLQSNKDLSFGEKSMLEKAKNLIIEEISCSLKHPEDDVEKQLDKLLN